MPEVPWADSPLQASPQARHAHEALKVVFRLAQAFAFEREGKDVQNVFHGFEPGRLKLSRLETLI